MEITMRTILQFTAVTTIFLCASLSWADPGKPEMDCSCKQESWQDAFEKAEHVLFGEVKEVEVHNDDLATGEFISMETFKGETDYVKKLVGSAVEGVSCRQVLKPGFYIVYSIDDTNVVLNKCVASRQLKKDDLVTTLTVLKKYSEAGASPEAKAAVMQESREQKPEESNWLQSIMDWFGS